MVEFNEKGPVLGVVIPATRDASGNLQYASSGGGGGTTDGLTDTQLRATPVPVSLASIADGADVAQGDKDDAPYTDTDGSDAGTVISLLKAIWIRLYNLLVGATASSVLTADGAIAGAAASRVLMGYSVRNTDPDAAASCKVINGTGTGDPELAYITLAPNESTREWFGPSGVGAASGLYLDEVTGAVSFVGWYK